MKASELEAVKEAVSILGKDFSVHKTYIFGSKARGDDTVESDIDLLIITNEPLSRKEKHKISDIIFEINLQKDVLITPVIVDRHNWEEGIYGVLSIKQNVEKEGIAI